MIFFFMTFFRFPLRPSIFRTHLIYHARKNKQKYTQQPRKRQLHTNPQPPPDKPIALFLVVMTGYCIYQNTPRDPPPIPMAYR